MFSTRSILATTAMISIMAVVAVLLCRGGVTNVPIGVMPRTVIKRFCGPVAVGGDEVIKTWYLVGWDNFRI